MLFLGLGTGLGTTLIVDNVVVGLELGHLPYRKEKSFEDYVGVAGLERRGREKWQASVFDVVEQLKAAFVADYILLGGGNVKKLTELPPGARRGDNADAFIGGERLWRDQPKAVSTPQRGDEWPLISRTAGAAGTAAAPRPARPSADRLGGHRRRRWSACSCCVSSRPPAEAQQLDAFEIQSRALVGAAAPGGGTATTSTSRRRNSTAARRPTAALRRPGGRAERPGRGLEPPDRPQGSFGRAGGRKSRGRRRRPGSRDGRDPRPALPRLRRADALSAGHTSATDGPPRTLHAARLGWFGDLALQPARRAEPRRRGPPCSRRPSGWS